MSRAKKRVEAPTRRSEEYKSTSPLLNNVLKGQESFDAQCSKLDGTLISVLTRFKIRAQGLVRFVDGDLTKGLIYNPDTGTFEHMPQWVLTELIDKCIAPGLIREAQLSGFNPKDIADIAAELGIVQAELSGRDNKMQVKLLKERASSTLAGDTKNFMLQRIDDLDQRRINAGSLYGTSRRVKDGVVYSSILKHLPSYTGVFVSFEELDADGSIVGFINGVYDLKAQTFRESSPADLRTKSVDCAYNPTATCATFEAQLAHVFANDAEIMQFTQRLAGTSIDGVSPKEMMLILHGPPGTGKSVLLSAIKNALGTYAVTVSGDFFIKNKNRGKGDAAPHLANIHGARFAVASEPEGSATLDEGMIKTLTGGTDELNYRPLYGSERSFKPVCTFMMSANRLPRLSGNDSAITDRRLATYQCRGQIAYEVMRKTSDIEQALRAENAGILNWLIAGYKEAQSFNRIPLPESIRAEVTQYQLDHDVIQQFFEELGIEAQMHSAERGAGAGELYKLYAEWATAKGDRHVMGASSFTPLLKSKGYKQGRESGTGARYWYGITIPAKGSKKSESTPATNGHATAPVTLSSSVESDMQAILQGGTF